MLVRKPLQSGKLTDTILYLNDTPKLHKADGYITVNFNWENGTASYHMPNGMFGMPQKGDIMSVEMNSRKILYTIVTSFTQDHVSAKGELAIICYDAYFPTFIQNARVEAVEQPTTAPSIESNAGTAPEPAPPRQEQTIRIDDIRFNPPLL